MASTVYEQVVVGVSVAALVEQIKVTATVAVTVQVRPGDVFPTLDEVVHGAVADQFGCTTGISTNAPSGE